MGISGFGFVVVGFLFGSRWCYVPAVVFVLVFYWWLWVGLVGWILLHFLVFFGGFGFAAGLVWVAWCNVLLLYLLVFGLV